MSEDNKNYIRKINAGHSDFLGYSQIAEPEAFLDGYATCTKAKESAVSLNSHNDIHSNQSTTETSLKKAIKHYQQLQQQLQLLHEAQQTTQQELQNLLTFEQDIKNRIQQAKSLISENVQQNKKLQSEIYSAKQTITTMTETLKNEEQKSHHLFQASHTSNTNSSTTLPDSFCPKEPTLQRLEMTHGLPVAFSHKQLAEFITYYQDTGDLRRSWQNVFMRWVIRAWEREPSNPKKILDHGFQPSQEARQCLEESGIPSTFYLQQLASFILHWRERGEKHNTWDSKFINHVKIIWQREKKTGEKNEREQRRHQTLHERLTDDSWATEGVQFDEPDWGGYKG